MARRKASVPKDHGSNIRLVDDYDGPAADQLMLTTFADLARAPETLRLKDDAEVTFKTRKRTNLFDMLHKAGSLDDDQLKGAYAFLEMYAQSLGKAGKRDTDDQLMFIDCRNNDPHEAPFKLQNAVRRRYRFKEVMPSKSFNLMQSVALDWIMDEFKPWGLIVIGHYPKAKRDTWSAYVSTAIDAAIDAQERV